jgi:hydroxyacylglutathione hydrolase
MLRIHPVPAFEDNYLWVIENGRHAAAVDPGDAAPVEAFLAERNLELEAILVTHHHSDHAGGVEDLAARGPCDVYGPAGERIAGLTHKLREGHRVTLTELGLELTVLDVPGHTAGHIAYFGDNGGEPVLFCGDTLFACGCGRLFEGTAEQMVESLAKLAWLPRETRVFCAHEYTMANIRFALAVEPDNAALLRRHERDAARRERGEPTVPSLIGEELESNPFMRWNEPVVAAAASRHAGRTLATPVEVFAELRQWKNNFR